LIDLNLMYVVLLHSQEKKKKREQLQLQRIETKDRYRLAV
jgi:hypothetical protein